MAEHPIVIIGGGFTGLTAAWQLTQQGISTIVLEKEDRLGGLAASFPIGNTRIERFYHHGFTNDQYIVELAETLGCQDQLTEQPSMTGTAINGRFYRLSTPLDLLRFSPLPLIDRLRLGLLVLKVRRIRDWKKLESTTAKEWLIQHCGRTAYQIVWEPLLKAKFHNDAEGISAVWFWNKLVLRGGSRGNGAREHLLYPRGGFDTLLEALRAAIETNGGRVLTDREVTALAIDHEQVTGVHTRNSESIPARAVLATTALPVIAEWLSPHRSQLPQHYLDSLQNTPYLSNTCLVLELDRPLSPLYWINVNDPEFPYVAIIEHTNFRDPAEYDGRHIVYLSRYHPQDDEFTTKSHEEILALTFPHLKRLFPTFSEQWVRDSHLFRARYSQPVVRCHHSQSLPGHRTPLRNLFIASMAQIYPEDRGVNYAIREGRAIAKTITETIGTPPPIRDQ